MAISHRSGSGSLALVVVAICILPACISNKISLEIFDRACHCFDDHNVYKECAEELRLGVEGAFHVGSGSVEEYCGGACLAETELALQCVEEIIAHDEGDGYSFRFSNGASLPAVQAALHTSCSYTPERGTFEIRGERTECGDQDGAHEETQLGYHEEGGQQQYRGGAFGDYCSGAAAPSLAHMTLLLTIFVLSASTLLDNFVIDDVPFLF
ncbi:uncharacterized protein LOC100835321 [Brachypodium distachyon]|uniref:DUF7731 domain-containing protein n=1 Tax=Brachypodium distachyon TaxID=15368 RepID=I1HKA9_BRADI|nr:uncharacterized protein LOC100835321 [Brachypodium distachyon]KQK06743.1 hypothetical protein BRADI_2g28130v3 [Brachypodium distachyon]|eukprot:XP_003566342.1 uncharacterized protein LOC100835321 [Brachypodium distachyon]